MKTYVLDASALMGYLRNQMGADRTEQLLARAAANQIVLLMSVINWGEAYAALYRSHGRIFADRAFARVAALAFSLRDVDRDLARAAATLSGRFALPYADSFAAALAIQHNATLVTSDSDFERVKSQVNLLRLC